MNSDSLDTSILYEDSAFPYVMLTADAKSSTLQGSGYHYLHWHDDLQYILVTNGSLMVQVNEISYQLHTRDAIFINSGQLHIIQNLSPDGTCLSFNFSPKMLSFFDGSSLEQEYVLPYTTNMNYPVLIFRADTDAHQKIITTLNQLHDLNHKLNEYGTRYQISSLLTTLWLDTITLFDRTEPKINKVIDKKHDYLHIMLHYIHQNYALDLSLDDIAAAAHVSESECCRCFKSILHTTPYGYLLTFRISKSAELLAKTNYTVSDIANMTGFNDSSHFIQYFKKEQGMTPNQYRHNL